MGSTAKMPTNGPKNGPKNGAVRDAMIRHEQMTKQGLLERAFAFAFRGLVYAQIWEDPDVDMEALAITPDSHVVTIASGGCNVLSYLTANPARITAVDLNTAHIALNNLKRQAAIHLPDHATFHRFFARADRPENIQAYKDFVRPVLDDVTRRYWEGRDLLGRRRISGFKSGFYKHGLLGNLIGFVHFVARLYGDDPRQILQAKTIEEQRAIFDATYAKFFDRKFVRWAVEQPAALFGLGIPPAQYDLLAADHDHGISQALKVRLEKLACDFELKDNYFAWQAFGRSYGEQPNAPLPPYLKPENYEAVRGRANRVEIRHENMTVYLASMPDASLDRYILLDAQDWMTDDQLTALWTEITRTAKPGARVLYRTAAVPDVVAGHIPDEVLGRWDYAAQELRDDWTRRDRSSVYGATHLWTLKPA